MSVGIIAGNVKSMTILSATVDLGSVAANTTEEETATVSGVKTGDYVAVQKPTLEAGIILGTCRVTADNTVAIQVTNPTGTAVDAASESMQFLVIRPENAQTTVIV